MEKRTVLVDINEVKVKFWDEIVEILEDKKKDEDILIDSLIERKNIVNAIESMDKLGGLNGGR